jgi:Na+-transporting NADH:ubiquinone oxidoreductase subunit NqrB
MDADPTCAAAPRNFTLQGDPRLLQIVSLGALLAAGALLRDFSLRPAQTGLTFAAALAVQRLSWIARPQVHRSYRSAFITALSLSLLLRADNPIAHPAAAAAAIASKSLFRVRGKHLFNPATFGIVFALLFLPGTWISPGQWGQDVALGGWMVALGVMVTTRVNRGDISWAFLAAYIGALALRIAYFGQRWAVLGHDLANGALLLFAFFMISDPMTGPNDRGGRIAHAAVVAALAYAWQFRLYATNGFIWALLIAAPAVPLWDALWPAPKFDWTGGTRDVTPRKDSVPSAAAVRDGALRAA